MYRDRRQRIHKKLYAYHVLCLDASGLDIGILAIGRAPTQFMTSFVQDLRRFKLEIGDVTKFYRIFGMSQLGQPSNNVVEL